MSEIFRKAYKTFVERFPYDSKGKSDAGNIKILSFPSTRTFSSCKNNSRNIPMEADEWVWLMDL